MKNSRKIVFIVGPTAVGKSEVAYYLAKALDGEIVSCDAMQVYREISIATNKPSLALRRDVAHHLMDIISVTEEFDAARYHHLAGAAIHDIHRKGKMPIVCGGSGLYMQVLLDGIFKGAARDEQIRKGLQERAQRQGNSVLYQELAHVDPGTAQTLHPNDTRRVIRALEVYALTKIPLSQMKPKREGLWGNYDIKIFALNRPRPQLYAQINQRVQRMIADGLLEEIRITAEIPFSKTAQAIIGVKEMQGYLKGEWGLEEAIEQMQQNTRHLAKRQLTWFRKDERLRWIMSEKEHSLENIVSRILSEIRNWVNEEGHLC